jgi:hypothetical protein
LAPGDLMSAHGLADAAEVAVRPGPGGLPGRSRRETRLLRRLGQRPAAGGIAHGSQVVAGLCHGGIDVGQAEADEVPAGPMSDPSPERRPAD